MMHATYGLIKKLVETMPDLDGDKHAMHARAKELVTLAQTMVKAYQPGPGEFKITQKAIRSLTKWYGRNQPVGLIVSDGWHGTGEYMKLAERPPRVKRWGTSKMRPTYKIVRVTTMDIFGTIEVIVTIVKKG